MTRQKAALITGCHGGIGRALCAAFRSAGFVVLATDRLPGAPEHCDAYFPLDLEQMVGSADLQAWLIEQVNETLRRLDAPLVCLVNNAAVQVVDGLETLKVEEFERSQRVNVTAPFVLSKLLAPALRVSEGSIINIGSVHGTLTKPGFCAYSTSKAGLLGLTRALAMDLAGEVTVNSISPAAVDTAMLRQGFADAPEKLSELEGHHPVGRIGTPEEIARLAVFLASTDARFITGANIGADGGIAARLHDPA